MKKYSSITKASSRRNSSTNVVRVTLVTVLAAGLLAFMAPAVTRFIGGILIQPVLVVEQWVQISDAAIPTYLRNRAALEAERDALQAEVATHATLTAERDVLRAENDYLRSLVAEDGAASSSLVIASVLSQPPYTPYDRIILNRGSRHGVSVGAPVFIGERIAVGSIVQTTPWQSVAELISSPGVESTVYVFGPDIYTTAVGQGGGVLEIGVPQGVTIAPGNPVTLPVGSQGVIGSVEYVESAPSGPEQYGYVTLPETLPGLQTVAIGTAPITPLTFEEARVLVGGTRSSLFTVPVPEGVLVDIPEVGTTTATTTAATSTPEL